MSEYHPTAFLPNLFLPHTSIKAWWQGELFIDFCSSQTQEKLPAALAWSLSRGWSKRCLQVCQPRPRTKSITTEAGKGRHYYIPPQPSEVPGTSRDTLLPKQGVDSPTGEASPKTADPICWLSPSSSWLVGNAWCCGTRGITGGNTPGSPVKSCARWWGDAASALLTLHSAEGKMARGISSSPPARPWGYEGPILLSGDCWPMEKPEPRELSIQHSALWLYFPMHHTINLTIQSDTKQEWLSSFFSFPFFFFLFFFLDFTIHTEICSSGMRQTSTTSQEIPCKPFDDFHLLFTHCKSLPLTNCTKGILTFKATNLLITMAALYMPQD